MGAVDDIKANLDLDQVAQLLGTNPDEANVLVDEALASLVGQLDNNVSDAAGAASLTRALDQHVSSAAFGNTVDLGAIDTADGAKIVDHVYSPTQLQALSGGQSGSLLQKLLPILAPIVMAYLAQRLSGAIGADTRGRTGGGGLGDILGGMFGGGQSSSGSGGGLGDILGDLLGGGSTQQQSVPTQQQSVPTQAPRTSPSTGSGPFTAPDVPETDLSMGQATSQAPAAPQSTAQADNPLGSILSDILFGRR